jgi:hypothetical protein
MELRTLHGWLICLVRSYELNYYDRGSITQETAVTNGTKVERSESLSS